MESKSSLELMNMNKEFQNLYYSKEYQKMLRKKRIKSYIKNLDINSIYKATLANLQQRKLRDNIIIEKYENKKMQGYIKNDIRLVIYTCIIGSYDKINEPRYVNEKCKYIIITDQDIPEDSTWEKIDINQYEFMKGMSNTEKNRYVKLHPHEFFKDYNYSIYIDGNILIISDMYPIIQKMGDSFLGVHAHPLRNCIYTEAKAIIQTKKAEPDIVKDQIKFYRQQGYPEHRCLYENTILVRKHNDNRCKMIMNEWWENMNKFTMRDQLSLPYVLWKNKIEDIYVLGSNLKMNPRFRYINHNV